VVLSRRPPSATPRRPTRTGRWTEEQLIDELRALHAAGVEVTRAGLVASGRVELVHAVENFGGLLRLRRLAQLPHRPRAAPRAAMAAADVLLAIRERQRTGAPLATSRVDARLEYAGRVCFGSWKAAIEAAGIDYDAVRLPRARARRSRYPSR
jgi:hypothetical protein